MAYVHQGGHWENGDSVWVSGDEVRRRRKQAEETDRKSSYRLEWEHKQRQY